MLKVPIPKASRISKIFITHLHVDHCFGILPFMNTAMSSARNPGKPSKLDDRIRLEFYGPSGLRQMIRTNLKLTQMKLRGKYAAHELLFKDDPVLSCEEHELHENEVSGRDIRIGDDGFWRSFEESDNFKIDAAPITHRVTSLGFVFNENPSFRIDQQFLNKLDDIPVSLLPGGVIRPRYLLSTLVNSVDSQPVTLNDGSKFYPPPRDIPGRKLVILGDTSDPSAITPLAMDATILIHEATNAWLPAHLEKNRVAINTPVQVREKAISRGHATPDMAGEFARTIKARSLFLNHFSVKFPDPGPMYNSRSIWARIMQEIEDQASKAWGMGKARAASDLLVVDVPMPEDGIQMIGVPIEL